MAEDVAIDVLKRKISDLSVRIQHEGQSRLLIVTKETVDVVAKSNVRGKVAETLQFLNAVDKNLWPLESPVAAFVGLKRPFHGAALGIHDTSPEWYSDDHMIAYVLQPDLEFRAIGNKIAPRKVRQGAVFVVYWRHYEDSVIRESLSFRLKAGALVYGQVCGWEWVDADPNELHLPENYNDRYQDRIF